ncbi:hypothetical protein [Leisingera thetidis]|uniref:hypothetical protein n=1 Tax=Leisingera thetidis TaxID=2930199 RepID=UPI0021F6F4E7|nr:hypothetical protein [Leisingera thetidis]
MRTNILGNQFDNVLKATSTIRESLYGLGGNDTFSLYHHDAGSSTVPDLSDRFFGGGGSDWLGSLSFDLTADGQLNDYRGLSFDGGKGYDTVSSDVNVQMTGGFTLDLGQIKTSVTSVEHWDYDIALLTSTGSGDFVVRSGKKDDTLEIQQLASAAGNDVQVRTLGGDDKVFYTAYQDVDDLLVKTGVGHDYFEFNGDWTVSAGLRVFTGKGKDTVIINGSTLATPDSLTATISTGSGADTIVLEGMHAERLDAGSGADDIYVLTGNFTNAADSISTGAGKDQLFLELDAYSTVAILDDFSAADDVFVFDAEEATVSVPRNTDVTFKRSVWKNSDEDRLYMNNAKDKLFYGDNILVEFTTDVELTADNFTVGTWEF